MSAADPPTGLIQRPSPKLRYAFTHPDPPLTPVGFLDDLKRQADAAKATQNTDSATLARNAALVDAACKTAFAYFATLGQQLQVLQPVSTVRYRLDNRHVFEGLKRCEFRADARRKQWRGAEVCDHVVLNFQLKSGTRVSITKDFLPDIEKIESRLRQSAATVDREPVHNPDNGKLQEVRYAFTADFHASVRINPDHDRGVLQFQLMNLDGFENLSVEFSAIEVGSARLDELARWLVGEPHEFLKDGQQLRRVEA